MRTSTRTDRLSVSDRLDWWEQIDVKATIPTRGSECENGFRASLCAMDIGALQLHAFRFPSPQVFRAPELIGCFDSNVYVLWLAMSGTMQITQRRRSAALAPGDLVIYDSSYPFTGSTHGDPIDSFAGLQLHVPKSLVPLPGDKLTRLTATRLPAQSGIGAVVRRHLVGLTRHIADCTATDAALLATITLDLFAALCAHHLEAPAVRPSQTPTRALQERILAFIHRNLADPRLTADAIAAAHQISTRHLYKLFQEQEVSVAAWIRQRRLERCRHDLADPHLNARPIHAVAARWGFPNKGHFSRLFRATYGIPPAEYRRQVQREPEVAVC
ncbi:AraC family transcriptional regulator [Spongiactinospora gelatinilytica]|uniref:AraC family transcriptional regulator n=1 Tax=Spongiactinospora gelatinilytica TaxID=2666298 RepID=A0A2W2H6W3_9ACTN|nr:helix-turn-helix domain-containing protein [Spongiactinospora gelatinilytica]PZG45168.1 AraC family transcriptional regulator [Spongiactinospora gelatinilytica]